MDTFADDMTPREAALAMEMHACKLLLNNIFPQPVWKHLLIRYRDHVKATAQSQGGIPNFGSLSPAVSSLPLSTVSPSTSISPCSSTQHAQHSQNGAKGLPAPVASASQPSSELASVSMAGGKQSVPATAAQLKHPVGTSSTDAVGQGPWAAPSRPVHTPLWQEGDSGNSKGSGAQGTAEASWQQGQVAPRKGPLGTVSDDSAITGTQPVSNNPNMAAGAHKGSTASEAGLTRADAAGPAGNAGGGDPWLFRQTQAESDFQAWQRQQLVKLHSPGGALCGVSLLLSLLPLVPGGVLSLWCMHPVDVLMARSWAIGCIALIVAVPLLRCILGEQRYLLWSDRAAALIRCAVALGCILHRHMFPRSYTYSSHDWTLMYLQGCSTLLFPALRIRTSARTDSWVQPVCLLFSLYSTAILYADPRTSPIMPIPLPLYMLFTTAMALAPVLFSYVWESSARSAFEAATSTSSVQRGGVASQGAGPHAAVGYDAAHAHGADHGTASQQQQKKCV